MTVIEHPILSDIEKSNENKDTESSSSSGDDRRKKQRDRDEEKRRSDKQCHRHDREARSGARSLEYSTIASKGFGKIRKLPKTSDILAECPPYKEQGDITPPDFIDIFNEKVTASFESGRD